MSLFILGLGIRCRDALGIVAVNELQRLRGLEAEAWCATVLTLERNDASGTIECWARQEEISN